MKGQTKMKKMFKTINAFFLHDEDEKAHISDYIWFYGVIGTFIAFNGYMIYKHIIILSQ